MFSLGFRDLGLKVFSPEDLGGFAIFKCLGAGCDEESGVRGARVLAEFRLDTRCLHSVVKQERTNPLGIVADILLHLL